MRVKMIPTGDVKPYEKNPRKNDVAVPPVLRSIREFGFNQPIVCDENMVIIVGHTRWKAAQELALEKVPCYVVDKLTDAQKRAYRIADNKTAEIAIWDMDLLGAELRDLAANTDLDLAGFGFSEDELADLLAPAGTEGLTDPDDAPEAPASPKTKLGDVWRCGAHTLVCGDCTDADVVAECLGEVKPHLMVTDPPYGVNYDPDWRNRADRANGKPYGARAVGVVINDDRDEWSEAWALFPGDVAYVWHAGNRGHVVAESLIATGYEIRAQVIWAKNQLVIGRGHYHPQHEPLWYAVRKGGTGHWSGSRKQTTIWNIDKPAKSETGHSTQKPVECMKRPIENNSSPGQAVYDPFLGSGTTMIAAEMEGRACYGIELSPAYCDVSVERWENFTGEKATRQK